MADNTTESTAAVQAGVKWGQVIQIARGNLVTRLANKPLAKGELFVHTGDTVVVTGSITDLVINKNISKIFKGDLFAGANSSSEVYAIGSGSSLKWGGIIFSATEYDKIKDKASEYPNYVFMWNGKDTLNLYGSYSDNGTNYAGENFSESFAETASNNSTSGTKQPSEVYTPFAGDPTNGKNTAWNDKINPGDLFFYSPALGQFVVLHLSRSTDALTKINVDSLISNSMRNLLDESTDSDSANTPATLKKFLDGPARHYQYLIENSGWTTLKVETKATKTTDSTTGSSTITPGTVSALTYRDGEILYVPFTEDLTGRAKYTFTKTANYDVDSSATDLVEGDIVIAVPNSSDGKVTFHKVSLYSEILKKLHWMPGKNSFERADAYATAIWATQTAGTGVDEKETGDLDFLANNTELSAFIDRLFKTKVDIDPTTGKIISSQIPDYLLGAPKYQGAFDGITTTTDSDGNVTSSSVWNTLTSNTTAYDFAKGLLGETKWTNLDSNEDTDSTDSTEAITNLDTKLQSGCYWIYTGESIVINSYTGIFKFTEDADDMSSGSTGVEQTTAAEHQLNKGDWIIYNGEEKKFEVIDNTSSFVGLLVHGVKCNNVTELTNSAFSSTYSSWSDKTYNSNKSFTSEDLTLAASNNVVTFSNEHKAFASTDLSTDYIPVAFRDGNETNVVLANSRLKIINGQTSDNSEAGIYIPANDTFVSTTTLYWHQDDKDSSEYESIATYNDYRDYINTLNNYTSDNEKKTLSVELYRDKDSTKFQFGQFNFQVSNVNTKDNIANFYNFEIRHNSDAELYLPSYTGVLTTEGYVNNGFAVIKEVIEDLYDTVTFENQIRGTEEWLQTVKTITDENGESRKVYFDSKVKEDYTANTSLILNLFYGDSNTDELDHKENTSNLKSRLSVYTDISGKYFNTVDYGLMKSATSTTAVATLNPSTRASTDDTDGVENILPNHSGVLLNNNSVIDGGEW